MLAFLALAAAQSPPPPPPPPPPVTPIPAPRPSPAPSPQPVTPAPSNAPGAPATSVSVTWCAANCNTTTLTLYANAVCLAAGTTGCTNSGCGATCSSRRALKQSGSILTVTLPAGTTTATAQALQNQIAAGNLVSIGIASTTVVSVAGATFVANPSPVPFLPSSPQSPTGASICSCSKSGTVSGVTCSVLPCVTLSTCVAQLNALNNVGGFSAACCTTTCGVQLKALNTQGSVCAVLLAANVNANGCGKGSKKGLLGLLGLLGLIPLCLVLLLCCLCLLRRKRRGQAMLFSVTNAPAVPPAPMPHMHAPIVGGPASFHP